MRDSGLLLPLVVALLSVGGVLLCPSPGIGDSTAGSPLFGPSDPLAITLEAPWRELKRHQKASKTHQGRLTYIAARGETIDLEVRIIRRGKSRLETCSVPMLTLELVADQIAGTIFEGNRVMHLTAQCQAQPSFLQFMMLEYLSYRVFSVVSEHGLGARPLSIEYQEGESRRRRPSFAFLVEDIGLAAQRQGFVWRHPESVEISTLDPHAGSLFVLFQYLLGNTDWSLLYGPSGEPCCHNSAILARAGQTTGLVPIPFDLDSSGLVGAPYASPNETLGIRSTRQRLYRGFCQQTPFLEGAIARFNAAEAEIRALFEASAELKSISRKGTRKYLDRFYETINDPQKLAEKIVADCRR